MQQSAPTAAVQPQPQPQQQGGQAGQGGANYPMASLYVGDLGEYNFFVILNIDLSVKFFQFWP